LRQRLSLDLGDVPLKEALTAIAQRSGLDLVYSDDVLPAGARVSLRAEGITVAAALTDVLTDADVDVVFSRNGRAALVPRAKAGVLDSGSVRGRVTDAKTGQPIVGASVALAGTRWRATTDENGQYRIAEVAPGTYTVMASRIGYTKQTQSVTVAAGQEVTVDVALQAAATELEQVVVTGTVKPTAEKAIPTPISVITADQIQQRGYQRLDQVFRGDIPGAFAFDPGGNNYLTRISFRGASNVGFGYPYVKTYIDGIEVSDFVYLATIDPNSIERIEVVRGPQASTIYGSEALGGVIQIFTKKGDLSSPSPTVEATVSGGVIQSRWGNAAQQDHSLALRGGTKDFGYQLGGGYVHNGDWVPEVQSTNASLWGGVHQVQGPVTVELSARYYNKTFDQPLPPDLTSYAVFSKPTYTNYTAGQQTYGLKVRYAATSHWEHTLVVGYDRRSYEYHRTQARFTTPADSFLAVSSSDESKPSVAYNTTYEVSLGPSVQSSLTAGVDHWTWGSSGFFAGSTTSTTSPSSSSAYRLESRNTGYFAQAQVGFREAAFLTAGLRAEDNSTLGRDFGLAWAPRVGVSYVRGFGGLNAKARVAYGKAIRPAFPGEADAVVTSYSNQRANPTLGVEQQVGADGGVALYFRRRASLEATYYNQTARDLIAAVLVDASTSPPTNQFQNVGRIKNTGWEFQGRLNAGHVSLAATYTITKSVVQQLSPGYTGDLRPGDQLLLVPKYTAGATLAYSVGRTALNLGMTHVGSWTNYDNVALYAFYFGGQPYRGSQRAYWLTYSAFTKLNLSVSQAVTNSLTVFVRSNNLTNNNVLEVSNVQVNTGRVTMIGVRTKL